MVLSWKHYCYELKFWLREEKTFVAQLLQKLSGRKQAVKSRVVRTEQSGVRPTPDQRQHMQQCRQAAM